MVILAGLVGYVSARLLIEGLEASIEDGDGIVLIEGPLVSLVAGPLKRSGVEMESLPWEPTHAYYSPRLVPILRSHGTLWLIVGRTGGLLSKIRQEFLADYRVVSESHFGPLALIEVVDEFPSDRSSRIDLLPVASEGWLLTDIQFPPGRDDFFVATLNGDVRWRSVGGSGSGTVLNLKAAEDDGPGLVIGGECGLIGMAFHPRFDANRRFFTHFCWRSEDGADSARVTEWRIVEDAQGMRAVDERIVLEIPRTHDLHNGGALVFGPDGYLYVSVGDGHQGELSVRAPAQG